MADIHPSAIIDPVAKLDPSVTVGPGCVIQGQVSIGPRTRLIGSVYLHGPLTIGADNVIYPFACLGLAPQDRKFDPTTPGAGLVIGNHNILREGCNISRATGASPTTIGDHNYLMVNTHIGHDAVMGHRCTLANGALLAGHVHVADGVILGGNAVVHQFCRLGRLSMLSGVAGATRDVPPFCTVYINRRVGSLNYIGLRRAGLREHIPALQKAFHLLYHERLSNSGVVQRIRAELSDPLCLELAEFVATTRRGLTPYAHSSEYGRGPRDVEPATVDDFLSEA